MDVILKNVKKKDLPVLRSLAKALGFEIGDAHEKPYDPEFVKNALQAMEDVKNGKGKEVTREELREMYGI
jgi:hypothetical protein